MKHSRFALIGVTIIAACTAPAADKPGVDVVSAAIQGSVVAWNQGDLDAHVAIFADSGTGGPPIAAGGRARARANLARYFTASRPRLAVDSLEIRALGTDHVLATGRWTLTPAVEQPSSGWFTEVWAHTSAGWRIIHEHTQ